MARLLSHRQFPLRAIFAVTTTACLAAALWQWPLGRVVLCAGGVWAALAILHLALMVAAFHLPDALRRISAKSA